MSDTSALFGTWRMLSWQREVVGTGARTDALGPDPVGFINYGEDGRFFALVVKRHRPSPASLPPSDEEKLALFDTMLAYAGTYTVDHVKAVHHVDASWNEAWTGTDQVRYYKLDADRLTLQGAPAKDPHSGQEVVHLIQFERVSDLSHLGLPPGPKGGSADRRDLLSAMHWLRAKRYASSSTQPPVLEPGLSRAPPFPPVVGSA